MLDFYQIYLAQMHKIAAALLLTLSLLVGQDGVDGFELGSAHLNPDSMSVLVDVSGGGGQRDIGGKPVHPCARLSCTLTLSVPERLVLVLEPQEVSQFGPSDDRGLHSTAPQQDPPVPRVWIG